MDENNSLKNQNNKTLHSIFENVNTPCCSGWGKVCVCSHDERVLRAYMDGHIFDPMTHAQREWCLEEADRAGEGAYPADEARGFEDGDLAVRVLMSWSDYATSNY